ncbi:hypothetical protein [Sabulicella rubraurantiaca]|uniref:hypothetical protein n=1 Tax=Sabulicella rubraurantiaca TaxID=2811429 RepID=UPI002E283FEF|nr:hypothetical protein [Sabulicella rubraurantiaca]
MTQAAAILGGAVLLVWPAFLNGYPLLFSDSAAFLAQTVEPLMIWDKPWIYGPFALLGHWHVSLWGTVLLQGLIVSHLVWLLARAAGQAAPLRHLALCTALAFFTTAPWSAAMIMPDILVPVALLCAVLLGWHWEGLRQGERAWLTLLGSVAAAAHLSNIPMLLVILALAVLLREWRALLRAAMPLAGAVLLLLATNLVGHGRLSLSPHGSTFLLARLVADGPAARTVEALCPARGWYLCAFAGTLPTNSDLFLWSGDSPVNRGPDGEPRFLGGALLSDEAREIVHETIRREPLTLAWQALGNGLRQLGLMRIGDTLARSDVGEGVMPRLVQGFPPAELRAYEAAAQQRDLLLDKALIIAWLHPSLVALAAPFVTLWALRAWRTERRREAGLILAVLAGVVGNAFATGALSMPHHRYGARVAWLVPLLAVLWAPRLRGAARSR